MDSYSTVRPANEGRVDLLCETGKEILSGALLCEEILCSHSFIPSFIESRLCPWHSLPLNCCGQGILPLHPPHMLGNCLLCFCTLRLGLAVEPWQAVNRPSSLSPPSSGLKHAPLCTTYLFLKRFQKTVSV